MNEASCRLTPHQVAQDSRARRQRRTRLPVPDPFKETDMRKILIAAVAVLAIVVVVLAII